MCHTIACPIHSGVTMAFDIFLIWMFRIVPLPDFHPNEKPWVEKYDIN